MAPYASRIVTLRIFSDVARDILLKLDLKNVPLSVPLVEFIYLVFRRMPGESCRRRFRCLLLYLCYVFQALINSLVC